ncbi:dual specificity protein phosphatase 3-like [Dermacentor andersoni]|uniref:dual specificity protein phosphatase 3-like n=1 Tax=Dermacentor andersoni TaxID=34620 RepID=UPI002155DA96|nr:dual specificity protein phosphatase 3-like isoform X1 [Dermacentor andersoni]
MEGITSFDIKSLKNVKTSVRTADGRHFVETRDSKGEPRVVSSPRFDGSMGFVPDLKPDLQVGEVIPGLHIGSQDAAADWCLLQSLAVTHVVNAVASTVPNFHEDLGLTYLALELLDLPDFTLTRATIDTACDFIDGALSSGGSVLVHCNAGVSRSCALVLAFLILRRGMDLHQALEKTRTARPAVRPNEGFLRQLAELQKSMLAASPPPSS